MQIKERHKRELNFQHIVLDRIEDNAYVIEKSNLKKKGESEYHRWFEYYKPVEKEVEIDGKKTTLQLIEHVVKYEDNVSRDKEIEYISMDVLPAVKSALNGAIAHAERAYKNKGEKYAYQDIDAIRKMQDWSLVKWLSLTKRVLM